MNCIKDKSCTFLDLFLFILNGIDTGLFNDNAQYNGVFYDGHYITPNVILKMRQQTRNIFQHIFRMNNIFQLLFFEEHGDNSYFKYFKEEEEDTIMQKNKEHLDDKYFKNYKKIVLPKDEESCTYDQKLNINKVSFIKHKHTNYESPKYKYFCDSFKCLKQTFQNFLILYNLSNELNVEIDYNSKRFTIEKDYCLEESKKIKKEIERLKQIKRQVEN